MWSVAYDINKDPFRDHYFIIDLEGGQKKGPD